MIEKKQRSLLIRVILFCLMTTCIIFLYLKLVSVTESSQKEISALRTQTKAHSNRVNELQKEVCRLDNEVMGLGTLISKQEEQIQYLQEQLKGKKKAFSRGGTMHSIRGYATAYSPLDNQDGIQGEGDGTECSTGVPPGHGKFAVDPKRIPYGSYVRLTFADGTVLEGIAVDTGGHLRASNSYIVDVFKDTYKEACAFGKKGVLIEWVE